MAENPIAQILSAIGQEDRIKILKQLSRESPLSFTLLMKQLEFDPKEDASRFNYHLRELERAGLIQKVKDTSQSGYQLTVVGVKVVQVLDLLEQVSRERGERFFVRTSRAKIEDFNRDKIKQSLITEAGAPVRLADQIAKEAEERLVSLRIQNLTAPMIREFVNAILLEKGLVEIQHELIRAGLPIHDVHQIITQTGRDVTLLPPVFRSPELIRWLAAEGVLSQYHLVKVIPQAITDHHLRGDIHLSNVAGWAIHPASVQHDIRTILSAGFSLPKQSIGLAPPKSLHESLFQISKFVEMGQTHFWGFQNIAFFNVFLAPFASLVNGKETRRAIQFFIDELQYSLAGRGGRPVSLSLQCHLHIPDFLVSATAIGPHGKKNAVYGDYIEESRKILATLIDVLIGKNSEGPPVLDPVLILALNKKELEDPILQPTLERVYELSAKTGNVLFLNSKAESDIVTYTGDLFRLSSDWHNDPELDTLRTGCLDAVVLNLPRIALTTKQ
ncbi:MAG: anaerobic ribonucleoside-triphosphate reductase, partial [Candidatus Ranarchaeia archaeon]